MKVENCKIGTRVILKSSYGLGRLNVGMKGTILEDYDDSPFVSWDDFTDGHNSGFTGSGLKDLVDGSSFAVAIRHLKRIDK